MRRSIGAREAARGAIIIMVGKKASGRGGQRKRVRTQASATAKAQSVSPMKGGRDEADLRLATEAVRQSELARPEARENGTARHIQADRQSELVTHLQP